MIARLQRLAAGLIAAALLAAGCASWSTGRLIWVTAAVLLLAGVYGGVLGLEFFLLRRSYADHPESRPSVRTLFRCWLAEAITAPRVFLWRQPFRADAFPDSLGDRKSPAGVVLVHGFVCNRGLWNPWTARLLELGIPYVAVTMEPPFGSIDAYTDALTAAVQALESSTGRTPLVVGHSMGGLAIRAWLARQGAHGMRYQVITIGTPHGGTRLARQSRTRNGREMQVDSPWLQALGRAETPGIYSRFICFWSRCDNIVVPALSATLPGADNRHLEATPHVAMAYHPAVFDEVVRRTRSEARPAA